MYIQHSRVLSDESTKSKKEWILSESRLELTAAVCNEDARV